MYTNVVMSYKCRAGKQNVCSVGVSSCDYLKWLGVSANIQSTVTSPKWLLYKKLKFKKVPKIGIRMEIQGSGEDRRGD